MPRPNSFIAYRVALDPPLDGRSPAELARGERGLTVQLDDRRFRLDPADPRSMGLARVFEGLSRLHSPAYVESDPAGEKVERLLIPRVTRVLAMTASPEGGFEVELELSQARHRLLPGNPDFAEIEKALRRALADEQPLVIVEDDGANILAVGDDRPDPEGRPLPRFPRPRPKPVGWFERVRWWWCWPWRCWRCVSKRKAQQIFDAMAATSCDPLAVPPPCIPFMYPDDGCWARAHEMCRLMIAQGYGPRKVWIEGNLHTPTRNNPNCYVNWNWHVAPTLCVRRKFFWKDEMVIDPSLFTTPVSQATWKGVQGDPNATLTPSDASIYYLWGSVTDPTYSQTNYYLDYYRTALMNRSLSSVGPPPYANCP